MEQEPILPLSASQRETLTEAMEVFVQAATPEAARWLAARGISLETADGARLGVVPSDPPPGFEQYRGMLAIPYLSLEGYPLSIRFRCLGNHHCRDYGHGKYMTMPGDRARLYNVRALEQATDTIGIAEGEMDALVLNQIGIPAVAVAGAEAWQPHYRVLMAGFSRVWMWADPDEAGSKLANRITQSLRQAKVVKLDGGDVNDCLLTHGADYLRELVGL